MHSGYYERNILGEIAYVGKGETSVHSGCYGRDILGEIANCWESLAAQWILWKGYTGRDSWLVGGSEDINHWLV